MKERITCACAGGHINTSFQCLNTNLWGAGAGALLGLWDREPSGSLSLEFGAMMRDRISENSKIVGVELWQLQDIFPRIGFLTLQVCSLLMRLLSAGPSGECALPFFFARDLEKRGSTCSFALCRDVVARVPSTFWFGSEGMIGRITHCTSVVVLSDLSGIFLCCLDWWCNDTWVVKLQHEVR